MRHAIGDYEKATHLMPDLALAHLNRGILRGELEEHEEAMQDLSQAIASDEEFPPSWFQRAQQHLEKGDISHAAADLDRVLGIDPEFVPALFLRAQIRHSQDELHGALADIEELLRLVPDMSAAHVLHGCIKAEMGDDSCEEFEVAIRLNPENADQIAVQKLLAEASRYHRTEDFENSIAKASEAIESDVECLVGYHLRASSYWYSGEYVEAIEDFTRLLNFNVASEVRGSRGQVYAEMGEYDLALQDLDLALESPDQTDSSRAYILSGRGLALGGLARFDEADSEFRKSIELCPENGWVHYNQGLVYASSGEHKKASICLRLSFALDEPKLTPLKRRRATAYLEKHPDGPEDLASILRPEKPG